jgi:hypothetical protein
MSVQYTRAARDWFWSYTISYECVMCVDSVVDELDSFQSAARIA